MMLFQKKGLCVAGITFLTLMLVSSFADMAISSSLFNLESAFGNFFAAYGEYAGLLIGAIGAGLLLASTEWKMPLRAVFRYIFALLVLLFNGAYSLGEIKQFMPQYYGIGATVEVAIAVIAFASVLFAARKTDKAMLFRVGMVLCLATLFAPVATNLIKSPWARPRYRAIVVTDGLPFQNWWQAGTALRDQFTAVGVAKEEFKSFPSGHMSEATLTILLTLLPAVIPKIKKWEPLLVGSGLAFPILVAVSRIIMGAHFLSDVTVGFACTYIIALLLVWAFQLRQTTQGIMHRRTLPA